MNQMKWLGIAIAFTLITLIITLNSLITSDCCYTCCVGDYRIKCTYTPIISVLLIVFLLLFCGIVIRKEEFK